MNACVWFRSWESSDSWAKFMPFPLYTKEHEQMTLRVCNSQRITSVSVKNKSVGNSLARIILQSEVPQGQQSVRSPLLMMASFPYTHQASLSPVYCLGLMGALWCWAKGTVAGFTVTRRELELMLDHKRGLPEVALRPLLLSGAI